MSLSATVLSLADTITLKRTPKGTFVNGRHQPGVTTASPLRAVVAPVTGRELEQLPEGLSTKEVVQVFTVERLYPASDVYDSDVLEVEGDDYEVQTVEPWHTLGGFFRSLATKE